MKIKIFMLMTAIMATESVLGALPLREPCFAPFSAIKKANQIVVDGSCPAGYILVSSVLSCLNNPEMQPGCVMFALANTPYTDGTGDFEFSEICPL